MSTPIRGRIDAIGCSPQGVLVAFKPSDIVDSVYRSLDSGDTWIRAAAVVPANVTALCFDANGRIIVASSSGGIFRSADNGGSWKNLNPVGGLGVGARAIN